jgi:hypothetical protein
VSIVDDRRLAVIVPRDTTFERKLDAATSRQGLLNFTPYGKEDRQGKGCNRRTWDQLETDVASAQDKAMADAGSVERQGSCRPR